MPERASTLDVFLEGLREAVGADVGASITLDHPLLADLETSDVVAALIDRRVLVPHAARTLEMVWKGYLALPDLQPLLAPGASDALGELFAATDLSAAGAGDADGDQDPARLKVDSTRQIRQPEFDDDDEGQTEPAAPPAASDPSPSAAPPGNGWGEGSDPAPFPGSSLDGAPDFEFERPDIRSSEDSDRPPTDGPGVVETASGRLRRLPGVGDRLGKCLITEKIGEGSSCVVYRALHETLRVSVAIKLLLPWRSQDPQQVERFVRTEAQTLARLHHESILRILDCDHHEGLPYLLLEYLDGFSLDQFLEQSGRLSPAAALGPLLRVADGLRYAAKQGVIHRDVKPANILLTRSGDVRIADLGLARILGQDDEPDRANGALGRDEPIVGTPAYIAPEQVMGARDLDHRADIYSLGITLFEALSGERPFHASNAMLLMLAHVKDERPRLDQLVPELSPKLVELVEDMIARDREARPATWEEVVTRMESCLGEARGDRSADGSEPARRSTTSFWGSLTALFRRSS